MASPVARWRTSLAVLLLVSLSLAGCLGDEETPTTDGTDAGTSLGTEGNQSLVVDDSKLPSIEGFVRDTGRAPLPGAEVRIQNRNATTVTNETGHYAFHGLTNDEVHILIASHEGYEKTALQVVPIKDKLVRLDFILDKEPEAKPYVEVIERNALISCQFNAGAGHDHGGNGTEVDQECSGVLGLDDTNADDIIEVEVGPGVVGIVVEARWDHGTALAEFLRMRIETVGYGDLDAELGELISNSPMTIPLAQDAVSRYYTGNGGYLRIDLDAHFEDDDEQAAGGAFAFQQEVELYVSAFYVEPNPPSYSAIPDA